MAAQYGASKWSPQYTANLVPTDSSSLAFSRSVAQVQAITYGAVGVTSGLFYPNVSPLFDLGSSMHNQYKHPALLHCSACCAGTLIMVTVVCSEDSLGDGVTQI